MQSHDHSDKNDTALKTQNMVEMEAMTSNWRRQLEELQVRQRQDFRRKVVEMFEARTEESRNNRFSGFTEDLKAALVKKPSARMNAFLKVGSFLEKTFGESRDSTSELLSNTFAVNIGAQQLRTLYNITLCARNELEIKADPMQNNQALYSNNLSALIVLLNPEDVEAYGSSNINLSLFHRCEAKPELHFDPMGQQIDELKRAFTRSGCSEGSFFITRHSNFSIQLVFHLMTAGTKESEVVDGQSLLIKGYRSLLLLAHLGSITSLTIPLLLSSRISSMNDSAFIRRAEMVLKQTRGCLNELTRHSGVENIGRDVTFIVPLETARPLYNTVKEKLMSVFRAAP